jgi:Glycosyl hydrolase family 12
VAPLSRAGIIGAVTACAVLAACGLAAASFLGTGTGGARDAAVRDVTVGGGAGGGIGAVASAMPQVAASPRMAVMPKAMPRTGAASPSRTAPGAASASAPAGAGSATCTNPSFETSAQYGIWNLAPYYVYNNMWGISGYNVSQTLYACSYSDWYVVAAMNNDSGNGAVKTYPNAQRDFSEPAISSLSSVTSTFAETSPGTGIYEDAYDIWLNGVATSGSTEVMIWTQNQGQVPSGSVVATVSLDGRSWTVWKTSGNYIAFVATSNFTSGTMNLLAFFQWIIGQGWIPAGSTLGQVCYGAELVSTNGVPATFTFSDFSVNAS